MLLGLTARTLLPSHYSVRFLSLMSRVPPISRRDTVSIQSLQLDSLIAGSPRSLEISAYLRTSFAKAGQTDDLKYSINYAVLSRALQDFAQKNSTRGFASCPNMGWHMLQDVIFQQPACQDATLEIKSGNVVSQLNRRLEDGQIVGNEDHFRIEKLDTLTVIGVFTSERFKKQRVILDIDVSLDMGRQALTGGADERVAAKVKEYVEGTNFKTVEALSSNVSKLVLSELQNEQCVDCRVSVTKPDAVEAAAGVGVTAVRTAAEVGAETDAVVQFDQSQVGKDAFHLPDLGTKSLPTATKSHIAYLAFGTNQGNQLANINTALDSLEAEGIRVLATSSLYRSKPMYILDQPDFFNGCVKVQTALAPHDLLRVLKEIEYGVLGRVKHFDNGPRSIDLDIVLYDDSIVNTPDLNIPHIRMLERSFVMLPLCELVPPTLLHPVTAEPLHSHLSQLLASEVDKSKQESADLSTLVPLRNGNFMVYDCFHNKARTQLMAIMNVTPDSFSDGTPDHLVFKSNMERAEDMVANGVDMIDIGGCSTRPGSVQVSEEEELRRVLPVVKAIKEKYGNKVLVSIDTYRAKVAEESIKLGADIINDISAGLFDERMFAVIAEYGVPYIINHTRGTIATMAKLTDYKVTEDSKLMLFNRRTCEGEEVASEVGKELALLVADMYKAGIRRWQLILDPGLGFAKGTRENLLVIKNLPYFKEYKQLNKETGEYVSFDHMPLLLGPSRKKFIGTVTGRDAAKMRVEGTGACVAAGIGFGSDIVRVHDYREMKDVCLMCDAVYKDIY